MNSQLHLFMSWLERLPRPRVLALTLAQLGLIALIDHFTGTYLSLSVLYCMPVALAAWRLGRNAGLAAGVLSAAAIVMLNPRSAEVSAGMLVAAWNFAIVAIFFALVALLTAQVMHLLERERVLARTDFLTGACNRLAFMNELEQEILRALRHGQALSLIYIDLDGFKAINDRFGHQEGDRLLRAVGETMLQAVRGIDCVGRLGGDEFVVLLPGTDSEVAAIVAPRLREALLNRMLLDLWPVTFSIGVLTCPVPPGSAEQLIHRADELMYRAKQGGKDRLVYALQSA